MPLSLEDPFDDFFLVGSGRAATPEGLAAWLSSARLGQEASFVALPLLSGC